MKKRINFTRVGYAMGIVMILSTFMGCGNMSKKNKPCVFNYSHRLVKPVGFNPDGTVAFSKFNGKIITTEAKIIKVEENHTSPSIVIEDDFADFAVSGNLSILNQSECDVIELRYDENGIFESKKFNVGDIWEITFSDQGELVSLHPK